jgi:SagB-type dehydrogenase family enzyme
MKLAAGRAFLEQTKYPNLGRSDQQEGAPPPPAEQPFSGDQIVDLPLPGECQIPQVNLKDLIEQRTSVREYSDEPLDLATLSFLLWATQGVKEVVRGYVTLRTVPSAGARHAFETYLLVNRVEGLEPGLYRYLALEHKLGLVRLGTEVAEEIHGGCLGQGMVCDSAVTFIWTAVPYRMTWRYQERGYRYLYLDVGHVCQNLYLAGEAVGCGSCAIGAFDDDRMDRILGIDGESEFVIYLSSLGKKRA